MRSNGRRLRNSRGEFLSSNDELVPTTDNQLALFGSHRPTVDYQVDENAYEQTQTTTPVEDKSDLEALVTLKRWQISVTPDRAQVCLWTFMSITRFLFMLSITSFWFCVVMCIKTLPVWNGPIHIFEGYVRRNNIGDTATPVGDEGNLWADIFPPQETLQSYTLTVALAATGHHGAPVLYSYPIPLLVRHPLVWGCLMVLSFSGYHFFSFIHGCLPGASHATKTGKKPLVLT